MSFKPFGFSYTPPPTVTTPAPSSPTSVVSTPLSTVGTSTSGARSNAGRLISLLDDLTATSQYLQDAIVSRVGSMAVEVDPNVDPDTARALITIYGGSSPPSLIAMAMYDQILDANLGALQLQMTVGNNSSIQPNPIQVGSFTTVIKAVEKALVNNPTYNNWLPLQLSSLKADSIALQSWKQSLKTYPAFFSNPRPDLSTFSPNKLKAAKVDVNDDLNSYLIGALNRMAVSYSNIYQSMASITSVEQDAQNVAVQMVGLSLPSLMMISSMLNSLVSMLMKPSMDSIQSDVNNYSFIQLSADTVGMAVSLDQINQIAVSPSAGSMGPVSLAISGIQQQASELGRISTGVLSGLSVTNSSANSNPSNTNIPNTAADPIFVSGLGTLTAGIRALAETLEFSQTISNKNSSIVNLSVKQLVERRIKSQNDRSSLMSMIRSLTMLTNLSTSITTGIQHGAVTANASPQTQQEQANSILASIQTGSSTTFTTSGGQVIVNPPTMPPVSPAVNNVLSIGKIKTTLGTVTV